MPDMPDISTSGIPRRYRPTPREVSELLKRAAEHPLGVAFVAEGAIDAVAAIFGVHAFVIDAARTTLRHEADVHA